MIEYETGQGYCQIFSMQIKSVKPIRIKKGFILFLLQQNQLIFLNKDRIKTSNQFNNVLSKNLL